MFQISHRSVGTLVQEHVESDNKIYSWWKTLAFSLPITIAVAFAIYWSHKNYDGSEPTNFFRLIP